MSRRFMNNTKAGFICSDIVYNRSVVYKTISYRGPFLLITFFIFKIHYLDDFIHFF